MSGERCVGIVFFDIIMSHRANVMYCSKAKCTLFACGSLNNHHAKQHLKKKIVFLFMVKHLWENGSLF
jgi:hypothetical protein